MRLCQRDTVSCGACCGLYNVRDFTAPAVRAELARRTAALAGGPRTKEAFRAAAVAIARGGQPPLFPLVRVCPLLGFVDDLDVRHDGAAPPSPPLARDQRSRAAPALATRRPARVGCLAHPASTGGPDLRDFGVYDAATCESFYCPSHAWLTEEEAAIAEAATGDFHLYGLVVTDVPFLRAALEAVAARTGARVELRHLSDPDLRAALRALLALKTELAPGSEGLFGAFAPGPGDEPVPRRIDYGAIGRDASPYDAILVCVGADPRSGNDLDALEEEVRRRLDACGAAFPLQELSRRQSARSR